ncbi:MAG: histidine kinase [Lachnospiraceae bacterium]|nr:histidine kinase [Lachnospiraceae bacterium]
MNLQKKWQGLGLKAKFTVVIVCLVWVPVIAFALFYFNNMQESLLKDASQAMELELQDTSTQLAAYVDSINMSTQLFLSDSSLVDFLERVSADEEMTTEDIRTFYKETIASLERLIYNNPYLYQIRVYADSDTMQEMMPVLYRMSRMEKLSWASEESEWEGWHFDYEDTLFDTNASGSGEKIASCVTRIESYGYGEIGVLEVAISMETLFSGLYQQTEDQWHCYVDEDGTVYFGEGENDAHKEQAERISQVLSPEDTGSMAVNTIRLDGDAVLVGSFYSKGLAGTWYSIYDLSTLTAQLNQGRNLVFSVIVVLLLLLTWIINRLVNGLLKGFYNVLGTVREVQKGNLEARVPLAASERKRKCSARMKQPGVKEEADEQVMPAVGEGKKTTFSMVKEEADGQVMSAAEEKKADKQTMFPVAKEELAVKKAVSSPETGTDMHTAALDETGELAWQINKMLDHINELMEENIHREVLAKNAEIRSLQNQINAHFIYNVLESIKMMAEIEEKYEISDAITRLGHLLRYNMYWISGTVTVREEIEYIRNYIALMNLRFDYEIYLSENLPEIVLRQKIPKMTLQPIVENAICHGIEQMAEDTNIYVKGFIQEGDCILELTDAGTGMSEERLAWLQKKIAGDVEISDACVEKKKAKNPDAGISQKIETKNLDAGISQKKQSGDYGSGSASDRVVGSKTSDSGIGLKNVQDRIRLTFGSSYGIQVASREGCYTKVRIRIPVMGD